MTRPHPDVGRRRVLLPRRLARRLEPWLADFRGADLIVTLPDGMPVRDAPCRDVTGAVLWSWEPAALAMDLLASCPALGWVHSTWAGVEHLPLDALRKRRVILTNARGVDAGPIAEWVVAAVLSHLKDLPRLNRQQQERRWEKVDARDLAGKRILVVGTGSIGQAVAKRLAPFRPRLLGIRRRPRPLRNFGAVWGPDRLAYAARRADLLVLCLPLTNDTRNLVDRRVLAALPDGAGVVNVGRGETLDLDALLVELRSGRLWAALDVLPHEPPPPSSELWRTPGLLLSPHGAHVSPAHRRRHLDLVRDQVSRYLAGRPLRNVVKSEE